jgi:uncharacterized protein
MPQLELWQWLVLGLAAFLVGYSKTAIGGVASVSVVLFAAVLPARQSTGTLLPLLIAGDVTAIWVYRRHADWRLIGRLLPWVVAGLVVGFFFIGNVDDHQMRVAIGLLLLFLLAAQVWSSRRRLLGRAPDEEKEETPTHVPRRALSGAAGLATGFATMVANASGPVMTLYLLASGYAVVELVGAAAWLYFVVNLTKVPFSVGLGLLHPGSVLLDLVLLPAMALGAWLGAVTIRRISRRQFERYVLVLVGVSAVLLLV